MKYLLKEKKERHILCLRTGQLGLGITLHQNNDLFVGHVERQEIGEMSVPKKGKR